MNRLECLILGWCLGSVGTAFVLCWLQASREESESDDAETGVLHQRVAKLERDLQRAKNANLDAIAVGVKLGRRGEPTRTVINCAPTFADEPTWPEHSPQRKYS